MAVGHTIVLLTTLNKIGANMSGLVEYSADARSKTMNQNFRCRAWVNFSGESTLTVRASGNVSSVTDVGTGAYTMNFTQDMPDNDYCAVMTHENIS